jgi:hypothetical protein
VSYCAAINTFLGDENIEHQKLRSEYAQTQHELDQTQKRILSLQLQLRNDVQVKNFTDADKKN